MKADTRAEQTDEQPGVSVIKLYFIVTEFLEKLFSQVQYLWVSAKAYIKRRYTSGFTSIHYIKLKSLIVAKHSSLFVRSISEKAWTNFTQLD